MNLYDNSTYPPTITTTPPPPTHTAVTGAPSDLGFMAGGALILALVGVIAVTVTMRRIHKTG